MGSFQRFSTGIVLARKVRHIPDNDFGLTRSECLAQSIRSVPGVVDAKVRPSRLFCHWRAELEIGTKPGQAREQIKAAIKRCCKPKNHQPRPQEYIYVDEEGEYPYGFAGI